MNPQDTPAPVPVGKPSLPRRFFRWLFSWRSVKFALKGAAILVTLVAIVFNFENWRGKRAWESFKTEWEAKGEKLELSAHIPAPVPDDQNFAATPLFSSLFQYSRTGATGHNPGVQWQNTNAILLSQKLDMFKRRKDLPKTSGQNSNSGSKSVVSSGPEFPPFGNSSKASLTDMSALKAFYRGNTNYPQADLQADAATTVLTALNIAQPALDELRTVSGRPHSVFPVHFDENADALLPHLALMKTLTQVLRLRVTALLHAGKPDDAIVDVRLAWRLVDALRSEPLLITHLVRIAMVQITIESIWEGLAQNQWRESQILELQSMASKLDLLPSYSDAIRGERAFSNAWFEKMRHGVYPGAAGDSDSSAVMVLFGIVPRGLLYQNQVLINRLHQEGMLRAVDSKQHRVYPKTTEDVEQTLNIKRTTPYNLLAKMLFPALTKFSSKIARAQTTLDCLGTACALERYHVAKNNYPAELTALVPIYLASIPTDVMDGKALRYIKEGTDHYTLYSIGWDERDDGGVPIERQKKGGRSESENGDWVWRARP